MQMFITLEKEIEASLPQFEELLLSLTYAISADVAPLHDTD